MARLTTLDYLAWAALTVALFLTWIYVGYLMKLPIAQSPISQVIFTTYNIVYLAAGVVFSLFMSSLIFFSIKFRERGEHGGEG